MRVAGILNPPCEIRVLRSELPRADEAPFENPMTDRLAEPTTRKAGKIGGVLPRVLLKDSPLLASAMPLGDTRRALSTFTVGSLYDDGFGESRRQTSRRHRAAADRTGCKCNGRRLGLRGLGALSPCSFSNSQSTNINADRRLSRPGAFLSVGGAFDAHRQSCHYCG